MSTLTAALFGDAIGQTPEPDSGSSVAPDLGELLADVRAYVRRYVVLDDDQAIAVTLWVAHTHAIAFADCTPYLAIRSATKRAGKTRLLECLEPVVREPWLTGRTTAAALVRKVDAQRPTLLLDESDAAFGGEPEYAEALRGLLNSGYRRSGRATVCTTGGAAVVDFSTFGAKAIAGIGRLPDTVADRSIPIVLRRRRKDEPVSRWREREGTAEARPLRDRLTEWAKGATGLRHARPTLPDRLGDRAQDCWEPLLAIAELAGGEWGLLAGRAAVALMGGEPDDDAIAVQMIADIRQVFEDAGNPSAIASKDICDSLAKMEHRPWASWGRTAKPITQHAVARRLAEFEVVGGVMKIGGKTTRGYRLAAFEDAWERYLPVSEPSEALPRHPRPETLGESPNTDRNRIAPVTTPKSAIQPTNAGPGYAVTHCEPEEGSAGDADGTF